MAPRHRSKTTDVSPSRSSARREVFLCFLLVVSGTASLIYEVVWRRWLTDLVGSSSAATAIVLAVFMGGLSIGSWLAGRCVDKVKRPIRVYAVLELCIVGLALLPAGEVALLTPLFVKLAGWLGPESIWLDVARFATAVVAIGPPAVLMGATFPVVVRALATRPGSLGNRSAAAYSANNLGAVCGTLLAGFLLIEWLGLRGAGFAAAGLGVVAGLLALWVDHNTPAGEVPIDRPQDAYEGRSKRRHDSQSAMPAFFPESISPFPNASPARPFVLIAALLSGFCALGYETIWTRVLSLMTLNTTYAFSLMLAVLLLGLCIGSWLVWLKLASLNRPAEVFAGIQIILSVYALSSLFWIGSVDGGTQEALAHWLPVDLWIGRPLVLALCLLFFPATLMGASLPILCQLYGGRSGAAGRSAGRVYAANALGSVLGALAVGAVVAPLWGTWWAVAVCGLGGAISVASVTMSNMSHVCKIPLRFAAAAVGVASVAIGISLGPAAVGHIELGPNDRVVFRAEDAGGIVEVVEDERLGTRWLLTNRLHWEGSTLPRAVWEQRRQGLLPLVLHPAPRRVLEIGMGTGIKVGILDCPLVEQAVAVEISPAVVDASRLFSDYNAAVADYSPGESSDGRKVRVVQSDGRNYVALTPDKYDLIVNGLLTPYRAGVSRLYTVEHFRNCRDKLDEGGMFVAWVALRQIDPRDLKVLVRSQLEVFPNTSMWLERRYLGLISTLEEPTFDVDAIQQRFAEESLRRVLDNAGLDSPLPLLAGFVAGAEKLRAFAADQPLNTEDRPIIEFRTPKLGDKLNSRELGAANLKLISSLQESIDAMPILANGETRAYIERSLAARRLSREALALKYQGQHIEAAKLFQKALALNPDDSLAQFELEIYLVAHAKQCIERQLYRQARAMFRKAAEINPRSIGALASLAEFERASGNQAQAVELWEQVRDLDPHNRTARRNLDNLLLRR